MSTITCRALFLKIIQNTISGTNRLFTLRLKINYMGTGRIKLIKTSLRYIGDRANSSSEPEKYFSKSATINLLYQIAEKIQDKQAPFQSPGFCEKGRQLWFFVKIAFAEIANPAYVTNNMIAFMTRAGIKLVAASQANALPNPSVLPASKIYHAHFSLMWSSKNRHFS